MESYVVSRELAERLKAAGYAQETLHHWCEYVVEHMTDNKPNGKTTTKWYLTSSEVATIWTAPAPLSDELLAQLPDEILVESRGGRISGSGERIAYTLTLRAYYDEWVADYVCPNDSLTGEKLADKPADALAELWLWCKQAGHL